MIVTITRNSDGKVLATATTYVAPKYQASQTSATVQATVTDIGNNSDPNGTTLEGVRVTLTPPSGLSPPIPPGPESDTTDDSGTVIFPGVTPTSGSQLYSIGIASADLPSLYYQVPVADFDLSPTQVVSPPLSVQVYQPVKLYVALQQGVACPPTCSPFTGAATIVVTAGSGGTSWTFTHTFTAARLPDRVPDHDAGAEQHDAAPAEHRLLDRRDRKRLQRGRRRQHRPGQRRVPGDECPDLNYTFNETMVKLVPPGAEIDVTVQMTKSLSTWNCKNAVVVITGGPNGSSYTNYTTTTSATGAAAAFPFSTDPNIVTDIAPYDTTGYTVKATTASGSPAGNKTNTVTLTNVAALPTKTPLTVSLGTTTATSC